MHTSNPSSARSFRSSFLRVAASSSVPTLGELCVDSLGKNKLDRNLLLPAESTGDGNWECAFEERVIRLTSIYDGAPVSAFALVFDPKICHATMLGRMDEPSKVKLPALLHLSDYGTLRVTAPGQTFATVGYVAKRFDETGVCEKFIRIEFPAATAATPRRAYRLEVIDPIHPAIGELAKNPQFDGFRRNWLNIFQMQSELRTFANNAASDAVAINTYKPADMAKLTPPLIPADPSNGTPALTANDLTRQTLDYYVAGFLGYGQPGYLPPDWPAAWGDAPPVKNTEDFLDTKPSLLITAHDYVTGTRDVAWLKKNYPVLRLWTERMLFEDRDGDGLLEFNLSGNANSYERTTGCPAIRPSNWWDAIGFGYKDAYANALAYRAFRGMAELARTVGASRNAERYENQAQKLHDAYYSTFLNPATGVLAGWKSADGKLHDYYFTFVNGLAITCGLVPEREANTVMDRMQAKFREVGYTCYHLGLPGNLIPIRQEDYCHLDPAYGWGTNNDADAFQIYENGGATACMACFYIQALYQLGRRKEADAIFFPMLDAFEAGEFQGFGPNGKSKDWRKWDGTCSGHEGLLVDGYYALLAAVTRTQPSVR